MMRLAGYDIVETLHENIETVIYGGLSVTDARPVILKCSRSEYPTPRVLARLQHEYGLLRGLDLPGLIKTHGLIRHGNGLALLLEDFGGHALDRITEPRLDLEAVLQIAISVAGTLEMLHSQPILHKDVKPHNILLNPTTRQVKLIDLSLATRLSQEPHRLLVPTALEGTLAYMSPEQTGRMSRVVDARSDLYSFGVTLYELLTGALPFSATEPAEMIHSHLARTPTPVRERNPAIPEVLSELVMKLLAKAAEDRYQTARGLGVDLKECLHRWHAGGQIAPFPLGQRDLSGELRIPQRLYGREKEIAALLAASERVHRGAVEMLLLSGGPGVGKSALVQESYKDINQRSTYFIRGKFDQLGRQVPYAPIAHAFQQVIRQRLADPPEALEAWKREFLSAVGSNGQLLINLIPELGLILGPQPEVPELGPTESTNRFNLVFQSLVRSFATAAHPLILFLDDLQWADPASLKLLQTLLRDPDRGYLLVVGAYRDQDVDASHLLGLHLDELRKAGATMEEHRLRPLELAHVTALLADTLSQGPEQMAPLARLVLAKTQGNPFFLGQFLEALVRERRLAFDGQAGAWRWDLQGIAAAQVTANVVDLVANKLRRLSPGTQRLLMLAACIGHQFELGVLSSLDGRSPSLWTAELWEALREGVILPLDSDYRFLPSGPEADAEPLGDALATSLHVSCRFLHDRVQQAAYGLIPEGDRPTLHLRIGRMLKEQRGPEPGDEGLFEIVNHMNHGAALLAEADERLELSQLNLAAGKRAKANAAYATAASYLKAGMSLLEDGGWASEPALAFRLHAERAECEFLSGRFQEAEALFDVLLARTRSVSELAHVYSLRIVLNTTLGKAAEALAAGRAGLALFDVHLPATEAEQQAALGATLAQIEASRAGRPIEELLDAPTMTSVKHATVSKLLMELVVPAYFTSPILFSLLCIQLVNISLRHGNSEFSPFGYVNYGFLLAAKMGRPEDAYAFGRLGLAVHEKLHNPSLTCRLYCVFAGYLPRCKPLRTALPHLYQALHGGLEVGDLAYASYACHHIGFMKMALGEELAVLREEVDRFLALMKRTQDAVSTVILTSTRQAIANLEGQTDGPLTLNDAHFNEQRFIAEAEAAGLTRGCCYYYCTKLQLLFLHGDYEGARAMAEKAEPLAWSAVGSYFETELSLYSCLTLAALHRPDAPADEQARTVEAMRRHHARIAAWARGCPENYTHQRLLVEAELARIEGREVKAIGLHEQAISAAEQNGFGHLAAMGSELVAKLHRSRGRLSLASVYLREAHYGYLRWGAVAKARALEEQHPEVARELAQPSRSSASVSLGSSRSSTAVWLDLDVEAMIGAAQAIATETQLDKVLDQLMRSVLIHAGAQRGFLLVPEGDQLIIVASMQTGPDAVRVGLSMPLEADAELATTVVRYVARSHETVVLDNAGADPRFVADAYISAQPGRSILCLALLHQERLSGILYLENNAVLYAFTRTRVELLRVLSSQAAIAMENAQLYAEAQRTSRELQRSNEGLELQVYQRTFELRQANERLQSELVERARAERERAALQEEIIVAQKARLAEMSTPLIPITAKIMVMPLIGTVDYARAEQVLESALRGVQRSRARVVILDITGMTHIDTAVAAMLVATTRALRLLGAQAVLTGLRAEFARLLIAENIELGALTTRATLQSGIAYALERTRE
jgi:predicted ATPase/GAF domain-containing protein/ABC-type transporter Mla MlaB component